MAAIDDTEFIDLDDDDFGNRQRNYNAKDITADERKCTVGFVQGSLAGFTGAKYDKISEAMKECENL